MKICSSVFPSVANARFTPNRDQLWTDLRVEKFWISWTREQSLNFYGQIASERLHRCRGATDIRVNKMCMIGQIIRVTCDRTMADLRDRDPRTPFVSLSAYTRASEPQPRPDWLDTLVPDLRLTCDALRPISDRPTTWARPPRASCVTRQNFAWDTNFKSVLRPIYERAEWYTKPSSELRPTRKDLWPKDDPAAGHSQVKLTSSTAVFDGWKRSWSLSISMASRP